MYSTKLTSKNVPASENPLLNISQIGKNFLVKSTAHPAFATSVVGQALEAKQGIHRQYTHAYCMKPDIYKCIVDVCYGEDVNKITQTITSTIKAETYDSLTLTVKNYKEAAGLSSLMHDDLEGKKHMYLIKGLYGRGLQLTSEGVFVGFASGTGILVFADLVAHLILCLLSNIADFGITNKVNLDKFRLVLYTSFSNEDEALCYELLKAL